MHNDTSTPAAATLLLDLDGLDVTSVTRVEDGSRVVLVDTADECASACPACGVFARRVKEFVEARPRDLPCSGVPVRLVWRKRRWYCDERLCPRGSFTESLPAVPARARITARLRAHVGDLVVNGVTATVDAAARLATVAWATAMDAVRTQAEIALPDEHDPVTALGIDEVRRGRPKWRPATSPTKPAPTEPHADTDPGASQPDPTPPPATPTPVPADFGPVDFGPVDSGPVDSGPVDSGPVDSGPVDSGPVDSGPVDSGPVDSGPVDSGPVEPGPVDSGPVEPGPEPAKARVLADRWHVGFTDLCGGQGMLGQVEGRTGDDVAYWLAMQPAAWRDQVRYVAIDMCTVFVSAIRRYLPHATLVVDHFHVVKLAGDVVNEVRRRVTTVLRGRRGRASDPEWKVRNLLRRNRESLSPKAFKKLWNTLIDLGDPGVTILKAWIAKDLLRQVLALAGTGANRSVISNRLYRFYTWCADAAVPELERLATTIETWWPAIEAFLHTKITNAKSEGCNRVVKLDARNAFGYRNPANQRLRTRCATTRQARRHPSPG